jgi:hypothetical protein
MAKDLVPVTDSIPGNIMYRRCRNSGFAPQAMTYSMWNEYQIPFLQQIRRCSSYLKPAMPGCQNMEPQAAGHSRQFKPPGICELRPAIETATHSERVQRLAKRV